MPRLLRTALAMVPLAAPLALAPACSEPAASLALSMRAPLGLLDDVTAVELRVIDAEAASCTETGQLVGSPSGSAVQSFPLDRGPCSSGAAWCKDITLDRDGSIKVFDALASVAGAPVAEGCATAAVNQDPLRIDIVMRRFNPPRCCNDGQLQAGEQCDTANVAPTDCAGNPGEPACLGIVPDAVCECDCLAKEILLSIDNPDANPPLVNGASGEKTQLALAFSGPAGADAAGALRAVFTDTTPSSTAPDVNVRLLRSTLYPYDSGSLSKQLRLPRCDNVTAVNGLPRVQQSPDLARVGNDRVAVVYSSDEAVAGRFDVWLSAQEEIGCASAAPLQVNTERLDSAEAPGVAQGPEGTALVVWADQGQVRGRLWRAADGMLEPAAADLSLGAIDAGARPRVSGSSGGWRVVATTGGNVILRTVASDGTVEPDPQQVNLISDGAQDQPAVAVLADGRFLVVWRSGNAIRMQRFSAGGEPDAGDQDTPLTVSSPAASLPAVASSRDSTASPFYAVTWLAVDGSVWARFVTPEGFGFNSVTGQNDDFLASHPAITGELGGARSGPAVAIGGQSFVAFGWADLSAQHPGVYVRRFPFPE